MDIPLFLLVRIKQKHSKQMYMEVFSQIIFYIAGIGVLFLRDP